MSGKSCEIFLRRSSSMATASVLSSAKDADVMESVEMSDTNVRAGSAAVDRYGDSCRCGYARPGGCRQGLGGRGNALYRTCSPNSCARSTVKPLSGPSRGSKLMI